MLQNWSASHTFTALGLHQPETVEQLQQIAARPGRLKALGTRHSFNDIADSPGWLVSLERLNRVLALDAERGTVTVEAGLRYGDLARHLHAAGFALANLASLPHISVAGSCATATHGSGDGNASLAAAVSALQMVTAGGDLVSLSRAADPERFDGAVVALGALGIVTQLTLDIQPTFALRQDVYEDLPLATAAEHFDALTGAGYSVSLFSDWRSAAFSQVWVKRRVEPGDPGGSPPALLGAAPATRPLHPIAGMSPVNCTEQLGVAGPWHERLPHFRMDFTPSSGQELQSEYILPRGQAVAALEAIAALGPRIAPLLQVSEVRTIAADSLWLSPFYQQDSVAIHFTWHKDWPSVSRLLPLIEDALAPFGARPHWGKLFSLPPAGLPALYPRLPDFRALMAEYDPQGKFRNEYLDRCVN